MRRILISSLLLIGLCGAEPANRPLSPGLKTGQRPGPYSFLIATGPNRGQSFCFICETGERPAMIVFARSISEPLAKLATRCDTVLDDTPKDAAMGWMTVLGEKTITPDALALWSQKAGLKRLTTGVFDDADGPPAYKLANDADIVVLMFVGRKVTSSEAFRAKELSDTAIDRIVAAFKALTEKK